MKKQIYNLLAALIFTASSLLLFSMLYDKCNRWFDVTDDGMCRYDREDTNAFIENSLCKNTVGPASIHKVQKQINTLKITPGICRVIN